MLLSGILAGAGWMAVDTMANRGNATVAVAHQLPTETATTTTTTVATHTSSKPKPKPTTSATKTKPSTARTPTKTAKSGAQFSPAAVSRAVQSVEPQAVTGAVVVDRQSGKTLLSVNSSHRFHSASLVKLLIAIDTLHSGAGAQERKDLAYMIKMSDDGTASQYWVRQGGASLVSREASRLGLHDTAPPTPAGQWGNTWVSPRDMVAIYQYILGMPAADRDLIVNAMAAAPEHASDGFDQWFGIPSGQRADWAIKQGWGSSSDSICLHSTGLVNTHWRYIVVVMTQHPLGTSLSTGTRATTAGVRAVAPLIN